MLKKVGIVVCVIVVLLGADFLLVRYRNTRPLFAFEKDNIYYGVGYKAWHCKTADGKHNNYVGSYQTKYSCPILIDYTYTLEVEPKESCANEIRSYGYTDKKQYFTDCIEHIILNNGATKIELKDALENGTVTIEEILNTLSKDRNGIYRDEGKGFVTPSLSIRICKNDDKTLYYFASGEVKYDENYCTNTVAKSTCSFIKTYNILNKADSNDENYVYLTLRQFQKEPVVTVKILKSLNPNIEVGKIYEFTFETTYHGELNEITDIFEHANLTTIIETTKTGMEQVNTSCK